MHVAFACDHAGYPLKDVLIREIAAAGHVVLDRGTWSDEAVDYPDFARALGETILAERAQRGVLVCGSGVGAAIAANKLPGIRAGLCETRQAAQTAVDHNDINVLCLGARMIEPAAAAQIMRAFLEARFAGDARHVRRLKKIADIEQDVLAGKFTRQNEVKG